MRPKFRPGKNIAMKVPAHEFDATVRFYTTILGLPQIEADAPDQFESTTIAFGDKNLWIDKIDELSQAEIWLEIETDDIPAAQEYLQQQGCVIRNEIELLPSSFDGFWLSGPSNIIHLITS